MVRFWGIPRWVRQRSAKHPTTKVPPANRNQLLKIYMVNIFSFLEYSIQTKLKKKEWSYCVHNFQKFQITRKQKTQALKLKPRPETSSLALFSAKSRTSSLPLQNSVIIHMCQYAANVYYLPLWAQIYCF